MTQCHQISLAARWDDSSPGSTGDSGGGCHGNRAFRVSPRESESLIEAKPEPIKVKDVRMSDYFSSVCRGTPGTRLILCRDDMDGSSVSLSGLSSPGSDSLSRSPLLFSTGDRVRRLPAHYEFETSAAHTGTSVIITNRS